MQALTGTDTLRFNITIDPSRTTYADLGYGNSITFPDHSLCDPNKSNYGVGEWDKPCTLAYWPVTVPVKAWLDATGHPAPTSAGIFGSCRRRIRRIGSRLRSATCQHRTI
jgi:hypothetical protein